MHAQITLIEIIPTIALAMLLTLLLCALVWWILIQISKAYDPESNCNRTYQIERRKYNRRINSPPTSTIPPSNSSNSSNTDPQNNFNNPNNPAE